MNLQNPKKKGQLELDRSEGSLQQRWNIWGCLIHTIGVKEDQPTSPLVSQ